MTVLPIRPALCILLVLGLVGSPGCRRSTNMERSRRQIAEAYGQLPGLMETPHAELRAELARITGEGATPELLAHSEIPDEQNVAEGLAELFRPSRVPWMLKESEEILPSGQFKFNPTSLERAVRFREQYEAQRQQARGALGRPSCSFGIQYEAGFAADLSFIDLTRIFARLEAFHAAEALARDDVAAAIESLGYMFRLAACLAAEKHATARLQAALVRGEAMAVLQGIVEHPEISRPKITGEQLGQLLAMVQDQLKAWTPDRDAWIGDRALGMHAYELVRAGRLTDLLTAEETKRFADEGILDVLPDAARRNVNEDELYYLRAMRKIIEGCSRPCYERTPIIESIREDLHQKRNSSQFPLVAGRLLLVDIEKGHAIQARDRARCEAWALALAAAAGEKLPPYEINPLTGGKYEVVRQDGLVMVWGLGPDEHGDSPPVVVSDLSGRGAQQ